MSSNFNCSYMTMSRLTYILHFSVNFFFQPIYTDYAYFSVIWFSGFRGEDLNVISYQTMPNLHNLYKSAERNIPQKNSDIFWVFLWYSFSASLFRLGILWDNNHIKIFCSEIWVKMNLILEIISCWSFVMRGLTWRH
jgi:hypothetical protein